MAALVNRIDVLSRSCRRERFEFNSGVVAEAVHKALTGKDVTAASIEKEWRGDTFKDGIKSLLAQIKASKYDVCVFVDIGEANPFGHRFLIVRAKGEYHLMHASAEGKFTLTQWLNGLKSHNSFISPYAKILKEDDVGIILTMLTEQNLTSICKLLFNNGMIAKYLQQPTHWQIDQIDWSHFASVKSL